MRSILTNTNGKSFRSAVTKWAKPTAAAAVGLVGLFSCQASLAIPPTFSVLGPREFEIPLLKPGKGLWFFFQNAVYNDGNHVFDSHENKHSASPQSHSFLGISRVGKIFSLQSFYPDKVGFFWEYLQPEVWTETHGNSTTGLGDPLIDLSAYVKPTPNGTIGLNNIVSIPVGENELSNHNWQYSPSVYVDWQIGRFGLDNTIGLTIKSDVNNNGQHVDEGMDYYEDLRLRYRATHYLVPFVSYDYARTNSSSGTYTQATTVTNPATGAPVNIAAGDRLAGAPHATQHIAGAGALVYLNHAQSSWLDLWYDYGFAGQNVPNAVNGVFAKYVYTW